MDLLQDDLLHLSLSTSILSGTLYPSTLPFSANRLDIYTVPEYDDYAIEIAFEAPTPLSQSILTHKPALPFNFVLDVAPDFGAAS